MTRYSNVFFDEDDTLQRVLFLYGHTEDSFFASGIMFNSMEYMLENHLKNIGYDLVLFYNGVQRLYCYTQAMAEKRDMLFREQRDAESTRNRQVAEELASFLDEEGEETSSDQQAGQEKAPLKLHIDDLQIATFADQIMRREDVRTAIVFSDGWDMLENTQPEALRTLTSRFRSWYHLGANNRNIVIVCFSTLNQTQLNECVRHVPSWSFLLDKVIQGNSFTKAVKYISIPQTDELEARLRMEKDYRDLLKNQREMALLGAQRKLHEVGNSLKGLDSFLRLRSNGVQELLASFENDDDAFETLRSTRGWEVVADTVERISRTIRAAGISKEPPLQDGVVGRMREEAPFIPAGICCNMVLKGNPGTGKTTIAKLLGKIYRKLKLLPSGHVVETARDDLVGRYVGHTAANTRAKVEEAMGGILFVDEAYSLYRHGDSHSNDFGIEAIDTLIEAMTRSVGSFAVVLAGYPEEMDHMLNANPGFRSRFGQNIVTIEDYQPDHLQAIAADYLAKKYAQTQLRFDPSLLSPGVSGNKPLDVFFRGWFNARDRKHFGNARDCQNLVDVLVDHALTRNGKTILQEDFPEEQRKFFKEADMSLESVLASLDDIVGQQEVKDKLLSIVRRLRLRNRQLAARPDSTKAQIAPGHYLFCGNPGTGKSTIATKFAQVLGALRITGRFEPTRITGAMMLRAMERDGIDGMCGIIEAARGGVLFIDEAHQLIRVNMALQILLDPMLELRNELCVIMACYERDVETMFDAEPGLRSRLNGIFHFTDYDVDDLESIFEIKVRNAGYTLGSGAGDAAKAWFASRLSTDAESHNGRYAEQLLSLAEENMAGRLDEESMHAEEGDLLFEISASDIPIPGASGDIQ